MRLRPMTGADLGVVARLEAELFGAEAWSPRTLMHELRSAAGAAADRHYIVAERIGPEGAAGTRDALVGYAGLWFGDGRGDADLLTIATVPEARRLGVGGAMLDALIERARSAGCGAVLLEVRASNGGARRLYTGRGFTVIGTRRRYYLAPVEDAVVMRLELARRSRLGPIGAPEA